MSGNGIINFVEDAMGTIERISNVAQAAAGRRGPALRGAARTSPTGPTRQTARQAARQAGPRAPGFSITETIDAYTGRPEFVVRNGRGDVASCSSMAFAQRVRDSLG